MTKPWKFLQNIHGDEIIASSWKRSIWYRGSGKYFWQYHYSNFLNDFKIETFYGTRKQLKRFLEKLTEEKEKHEMR